MPSQCEHHYLVSWYLIFPSPLPSHLGAEPILWPYQNSEKYAIGVEMWTSSKAESQWSQILILILQYHKGSLLWSNEFWSQPISILVYFKWPSVFFAGETSSNLALVRTTYQDSNFGRGWYSENAVGKKFLTVLTCTQRPVASLF